MKGLTSRSVNYRSKSACSYCRSTEHQATVCPHVSPIWQSLLTAVIPIDYIEDLTKHVDGYHQLRWFKNPHMWGDLYKHTEKASNLQSAYQERQAKKGKGGKKVKRASKCGFCGDDGHTRRTCGKQKSLILQLSRANKNYRQWIYDTYVVEQGLSDGALISFTAKIDKTYNKPETSREVTTLCTGVNWETINVFSEFTPNEYKYWSVPHEELGCRGEKLDNIKKFLQSSIDLRILASTCVHSDRISNSGSNMCNVKLRGGTVQTIENESMGYYGVPKISNVKIVSRAPQVLAPDWVTEYADEMSVIFKKFSYAQLDFLGAIDHIKEWDYDESERSPEVVAKLMRVYRNQPNQVR